MKYIKPILLLLLAITLSSCYHAQIITDKNPSSQVIEKPWASSFIYGLVPPKTIETASKCPNGLAKVETKLSFLNGLASSITFGLYTPMHLKVTCAAGSGTAEVKTRTKEKIEISKRSSEKEKKKAFTKASKKSLATGKPVYLEFN